MSIEETKYREAIALIMRHDGMRFNATLQFINSMTKTDLELITVECIRLERNKARQRETEARSQI